MTYILLLFSLPDHAYVIVAFLNSVRAGPSRVKAGRVAGIFDVGAILSDCGSAR